MNDKPLVIYHGNCQDGFTAAWAIWKKHPDWEFYPAKYGVEPPDVTGRDVYFVDFSYKRDVILQMASKAEQIWIYDHHKTAEAGLVDLPDNVYVWFDMEKSGARLAWEAFHPREEVPAIVEFVEDRDLWRFKYPNTKAFSAYLFSQPYDFDMWDAISSLNIYEIASAGQAILDNHQKYTEELSAIKFRNTLAGHVVWFANVPYNYSSDMGNLLAKGEPFAVTYYFDGSRAKTIYSLRSDENGLDVSEIAKQFGGGGHKHAAGFEGPTQALITGDK
jgi:oligoribonuclease NrnB/cAMP/cGMP phosphodiesterase (DHH superfamily)